MFLSHPTSIASASSSSLFSPPHCYCCSLSHFGLLTKPRNFLIISSALPLCVHSLQPEWVIFLKYRLDPIPSYWKSSSISPLLIHTYKRSYSYSFEDLYKVICHIGYISIPSHPPSPHCIAIELLACLPSPAYFCCRTFAVTVLPCGMQTCLYFLWKAVFDTL